MKGGQRGPPARRRVASMQGVYSRLARNVFGSCRMSAGRCPWVARDAFGSERAHVHLDQNMSEFHRTSAGRHPRGARAVGVETVHVAFMHY
eukprot:1153639-Pelagomonas_calceolata.AAC.7